MNVDEISSNIAFQKIFNKINLRKKFLSELTTLEHLLKEKRNEIENLDKDIINLEIDLNLYSSFFKKYDIVIKNGYEESVFHVNEIKIIRDTDLNRYYVVDYDFFDLNNENFSAKNLKCNLIKFMHLLDDSNNSKLKERKNEH